MSGETGGGKGGSIQPARQSTGTLTNEKNDGKKGGTKKARQAAEDAANDVIAAALAESEIMAPDSGGKGTKPEHEPPAAAAQSRSNRDTGEVSKMQRQIAELEARLAEKESKVTDNL